MPTGHKHHGGVCPFSGRSISKLPRSPSHVSQTRYFPFWPHGSELFTLPMTACPPSFTWTCSTRTNCCPPLRRRRARTIQDVQRGHVWQGDCAAISIISLASYGYFLCASVISIEEPFPPKVCPAATPAPDEGEDSNCAIPSTKCPFPIGP